jgi:hypothetical protein
MAIGMTCNLVLVVVVFVDRSEPAVEIIHIISARKAVANTGALREAGSQSGSCRRTPVATRAMGAGDGRKILSSPQIPDLVPH